MTQRICSVPECGKPHFGRGWCSKHYTQWRTKGEIQSVIGRTCGWCQADISHLRANAKYCTIQHKKNAGSKRHREQNPGYYKRYHGSPARVAWLEANREFVRTYAREYQRGYRLENPEAARAWRAANAEKHRLYQAARRERKLANPGSVGVTERDWLRLVARYRNCCAYCGERPAKLCMDHVIPLLRGGRHAIGNILPSCRPCNSSKNATFLVEWMRRRHG